MNINKNITRLNFTPGGVGRIKYIVIHYCGSTGDAKQQTNYFAEAYRGASAHYFVGHSGDIWQSVDDANVAWHCGSKKYQHPNCRNINSLGIEMCCKTIGSTKIADENWYFEDATVKATIELTKELMKKYNISADHVIRHYDVTGKCCPAPYVFNKGKHTWDEFKKAISEKKTKTVIIKKEEKPDDSKVVWDFLTDECGFNNYAAAGIIGNLYAESGLKSTNLQNCYEKKFGLSDEEYTRAVDEGTYLKETFVMDKAGYGLAQWTYWTRKKALYEFIKPLGKSIGDLKAQLLYLWKELTDRKLVSKLNKSKSILEASNIMLHDFERPADQSKAVEKKRESFGETFYNLYAKGEQ